jgi:hypothetical protein
MPFARVFKAVPSRELLSPLPIVRHSCPTFQQQWRGCPHFRQMLGRHYRIRQRRIGRHPCGLPRRFERSKHAAPALGAGVPDSDQRSEVYLRQLVSDEVLRWSNAIKASGLAERDRLGSGTTQSTDPMIEVRKYGEKSHDEHPFRQAALQHPEPRPA